MKEAWHGKNTARFIYYSYKDSPLYPVVILAILIFAAVLLIINIVIPQTQNWLSIRDETLATQQRISVLNNNINFITNLNKSLLEKNRLTVIKALPVEKGFSDIIISVANSAVRSGVTVEDYSFSVGPIASSSAKPIKANGGMDLITLVLSISGEIDDIRKFIKEMGTGMPISEISSVDSGKGDASISLYFYSKSYRPIRFSDIEPIRPITAANGSMLSTLSEWNTQTSVSSEEMTAPSSDIPLF